MKCTSRSLSDKEGAASLPTSCCSVRRVKKQPGRAHGDKGTSALGVRMQTPKGFRMQTPKGFLYTAPYSRCGS